MCALRTHTHKKRCKITKKGRHTQVFAPKKHIWKDFFYNLHLKLHKSLILLVPRV